MKRPRARKGQALLEGVLILCLLISPTGEVQPAELLTLSQSIDLALSRSALVSAAREGTRGAEAQRKEALTGFLPKFNTSYSYTRLSDEPSFYFPGVGGIPAQNLTTGTKDNYQWQIEARQPLFAGGQIAANYEANRLAAAIALQEEATAIQDLVEAVQVTYFQVLKAERLLAVAEQSREQRQAHRDTAAEFFAAGLVPRNDLLHAEVELANGEHALLRARNSLVMAKARFNTLLRRPGHIPVSLATVPYEPPSGESLEPALLKALAQRPELKAAKLRTAQARSMVKAAQGEYYPSLNLLGHYSRYGDTAGVAGSTYKDRENWSAMVVAQWPFWEWGKTNHRVEAGLSREHRAEDLLAHARDQVALEVRNAYLLRQEAHAQIQVAEKALAQAEENFRINIERYREQVGTSVNVIDAQTLLTRAKADHANAVMDGLIQRARLARAMGEPYKREAKP